MTSSESKYAVPKTIFKFTPISKANAILEPTWSGVCNAFVNKSFNLCITCTKSWFWIFVAVCFGFIIGRGTFDEGDYCRVLTMPPILIQNTTTYTVVQDSPVYTTNVVQNRMVTAKETCYWFSGCTNETDKLIKECPPCEAPTYAGALCNPVVCPDIVCKPTLCPAITIEESCPGVLIHINNSLVTRDDFTSINQFFSDNFANLSDGVHEIKLLQIVTLSVIPFGFILSALWISRKFSALEIRALCGARPATASDGSLRAEGEPPQKKQEEEGAHHCTGCYAQSKETQCEIHCKSCNCTSPPPAYYDSSAPTIQQYETPQYLTHGDPMANLRSAKPNPMISSIYPSIQDSGRSGGVPIRQDLESSHSSNGYVSLNQQQLPSTLTLPDSFNTLKLHTDPTHPVDNKETKQDPQSPRQPDGSVSLQQQQQQRLSTLSLPRILKSSKRHNNTTTRQEETKHDWVSSELRWDNSQRNWTGPSFQTPREPQTEQRMSLPLGLTTKVRLPNNKGEKEGLDSQTAYVDESAVDALMMSLRITHDSNTTYIP